MTLKEALAQCITLEERVAAQQIEIERLRELQKPLSKERDRLQGQTERLTTRIIELEQRLEDAGCTVVDLERQVEQLEDAEYELRKELGIQYDDNLQAMAEEYAQNLVALRLRFDEETAGLHRMGAVLAILLRAEAGVIDAIEAIHQSGMDPEELQQLRDTLVGTTYVEEPTDG